MDEATDDGDIKSRAGERTNDRRHISNERTLFFHPVHAALFLFVTVYIVKVWETRTSVVTLPLLKRNRAAAAADRFDCDDDAFVIGRG